jgi:hypothetical protein
VRSVGMLGEWIWDGPESVQNALVNQANEGKWRFTGQTEGAQGTVKAF